MNRGEQNSTDSASRRVEPQYAFGAGTGGAGSLVSTSFGGPLGRPDTVLDYAEVGPWSVRAASVRGRRRRSANAPRSDDYAIGSTVAGDGTTYVCIGVCGGVPAGGLSHVAAREVSIVAVEVLSDAVSSGSRTIEWLEVTQQINSRAIEAVAGHLSPPNGGQQPSIAEIRAEMMTTLSVALVNVAPPFAVEGVSIGDTSCWKVKPDGLSPVVDVSAPEHAIPVTAHDISDQFVTPFGLQLQPGEALMMVSAGVGEAFGSGSSPVARELASLWSTPPSPYEFGSQLDFASAGFDDDRTAVGFWLR